MIRLFGGLLEVRLVFRGPGADLAVSRLDPATRELLRELLAPVLGHSPSASAPAPAPPTEAPREPPAHVLALGGRLSVQQGLTGRDRVTRCWALGVRDNAARLRLAAGERVPREASPLPRLRTEWCVCLAGVAGAPFWTDRSSRYNSWVRVQNRPGRPLVDGVVGRELPSKGEAEAYLAGAGFELPSQI